MPRGVGTTPQLVASSRLGVASMPFHWGIDPTPDRDDPTPSEVDATPRGTVPTRWGIDARNHQDDPRNSGVDPGRHQDDAGRSRASATRGQDDPTPSQDGPTRSQADAIMDQVVAVQIDTEIKQGGRGSSTGPPWESAPGRLSRLSKSILPARQPFGLANLRP
jgi:hypothetical protein